jgi:putative hydrolase of the HAD superfamily
MRNPKSDTPKKVVSFDLDGTVVDAAYGNMVWLEGVPAKYARRHSVPLERAKQTVRREYDAVGEANILWYDITYWLGRFDVAVSIPDLLDEYRDHIRLLPHVAEVISLLSEKYRLVIASNAARIFVEKELGHTGLERHFSRIISATSDFGMVKKEEQFYWKLCAVMGISPSEIVHVGDHSVFDVEVPLRIGIDSYHYDPSHDGAGRTIRDFRELLDLL